MNLLRRGTTLGLNVNTTLFTFPLNNTKLSSTTINYILRMSLPSQTQIISFNLQRHNRQDIQVLHYVTQMNLVTNGVLGKELLNRRTVSNVETSDGTFLFLEVGSPFRSSSESRSRVLRRRDIGRGDGRVSSFGTKTRRRRHSTPTPRQRSSSLGRTEKTVHTNLIVEIYDKGCQ